VRALIHESRNRGLSVPLLENLLPSNRSHLQSLLSVIAASGETEISLLGLAFKSHTDDIRESAMVAVAQVLLERGYRLRLYDPQVNLSRLIGSNKRAVEVRLPGLESLLCTDLAETVGQQGTVVVAQRCVTMAELARVVTPRHKMIDVNGWPELQSLPAKYEGFCW
jgi:GDP-mannose 6-dehydrogenase